MKKILILLSFCSSLFVFAEDSIKLPSGEKFTTHTENFDLLCNLKPTNSIESQLYVRHVDRIFIKTTSPVRVTEAFNNDSFVKSEIEKHLGKKIIGREFYVTKESFARCGTCEIKVEATVDLDEPADSIIHVRNGELAVKSVNGDLLAEGACRSNEIY